MNSKIAKCHVIKQCSAVTTKKEWTKNIYNAAREPVHKSCSENNFGNTFSKKSLNFMQQICVFHDFSWFLSMFERRFLRDYWELANKLDIWDYLLLELVSFLLTKKIIRLAAERQGWRQMLYFRFLDMSVPTIVSLLQLRIKMYWQAPCCQYILM